LLPAEGFVCGAVKDGLDGHGSFMKKKKYRMKTREKLKENVLVRER